MPQGMASILGIAPPPGQNRYKQLYSPSVLFSLPRDCPRSERAHDASETPPLRSEPALREPVDDYVDSSRGRQSR